MPLPIRPMRAFVLRLWHEPGDEESQAGWRGLVRPLDASDGAMRETTFHGLDRLPDLVYALLTEPTSDPKEETRE